VVVALVAQGAGVEGGLGLGQGHVGHPARRGQGDRHLEGVQGGAGVTVGPVHQVVEGIVVGRGPLRVEAPMKQDADRVRRQSVQAEQARARQQGGVDLEVRVLGGGSDQREQAVLHVGQEGVLLRLVEAVDLVEFTARSGPPGSHSCTPKGGGL